MRKSIVFAALAVSLAFGAAGCGSQSETGGFGSFSLTSVVPNPVPGMVPTMVTINGGDFSNQIGTIVQVEWIADTGTPFLGGTSQTATTTGTITSATTIDTTTPRVVICGPSSITAAIRVTLPSGVWGQSAAGFITFSAPTVTSFAGGGIFPAAVPTAFILNGTGFGDIGSPVTVHWSSPSPIFDAGASTTTTTTAVVASATTISGTSPLALVCGPVSIGATITRVSFQDGSCTPTAGPTPSATFVAPTITSVLNTGGGLDNGTNGFAAAIPESFTVTGTGYGPLGGTATVNMTAANTIFVNGTTTTTSVTGTITSTTTISVAGSALAAMCNNPAGLTTSNVTFEVTLPDGACTPTGAGAPGVYNAPQITSIVNTGGRAPDTGTNGFAAAIPETFSITGTRLGVAGDAVSVTFTSAGGTLIYSGATAAAASVPATVTSSTLITGTSPEAVMCAVGLTADNQNVSVLVNGGSCNPVNVVAVMNAPSFTSIVNTQGGSPWNGTANFAPAVPESFLITGDRFGPVGGIAIITWEDNGAPTPYAGGTANSTTVLGQITSSTTITGISPEAALCSTIINVGQNILVTLQGGSCTQNAIAALLLRTMTTTAIANDDRGGATFFSAIPEQFTVTGTDFGPIGGTATVRFTVDAATAAGTAATPFAGGTAAFVDVLATITSRTTIVGTSPDALLCPIPGTDPATQLTAGIDLSVTLEGGSCTDTDAPLNLPALIQGPSLVSADLLIPTPPATGSAGGPALNVPTTVALGQDEMPEIRITGTGFAPLGAVALVTFVDIGNGTGAADLNGAATITVPAFVVSETVIEGRLPAITMARLSASEIVRTSVVLAPNGSCTFDDAMVNLVAPPTITTVVNSDATAGNNGLTATGFAAADFYAGQDDRMLVTGTAFDSAAGAPLGDLFVYSTVDGLDAVTQLPNRRLGTNTPTAGTPWFTDLGFRGNITGPATAGGSIRLEKLATDLDADNDGLVPYSVRYVNADGQFHDFAAGNIRVQSATVNPTGMGSTQIRNNNSIAVNPVSFTDDFGTAGADVTDGTDGANILAVSNDETPGGGFGLFNATDILLMRSVDGGRTFANAPLGAAAIDLLPATAVRSFAKVAFDKFGNGVLSYIVDDFAGINFDATLICLTTADSGATWVLRFLPNYGPFSAGLINSLDVSVGNDEATTGSRFGFAFVDSTATTAPGDVVRAIDLTYTGYTTDVGAFGNVPISQTVVAPLGGITACECAIGNSGEFYVGWQEPPFVGPPPFTTNFMFDVDLDGIANPTFTFGTDQLAFTDFIPNFALPAYSDVQFFEPTMDMCVARAGAGAGRLLWVYDHIRPNVGPEPDHAQVIARYSDDNGTAWSAGVVTHAVDAADRFIPAVCSDAVTGRFYLSWYDTTSSIATGNTSFERYGAASANGVTWSTSRNLSGTRGPSTHPFDFDTDFGAYAGIAVHNGCVYATWGDTVDTASGAGADPIIVGYQQK